MPQPTKRSDAPCPFQSALLLTDDEANASADRNVLRGAGVRQVRIQTSGVEAARYLAERVTSVLFPVTEAVVCLPLLEDMNAAEFATLIRSHPLLPHIPLLAVTGEPGQAQRLLACGFNGVLQRPFTTNALLTTLHTLAGQAKTTRTALIETLRRDKLIPPHDAFDELLNSFIPPDKDSLSPAECLAYGRKVLADHLWKEALPYLNKAATSGEAQGEARMVLAALWKERHEPAKMKSCLLGSLQAFVDEADWRKVRTLSLRLAVEYPAPPAPLARELERRIRLGQMDSVADMLAHVRDMLAPDEIKQMLLEGAQNSTSPEDALTAVLEALRDSDDADSARLADSLETESGRKSQTAPKKRRWFGRRAEQTDAPSGKTDKADDNSERKKEIGIPLAELPEYVLDDDKKIGVELREDVPAPRKENPKLALDSADELEPGSNGKAVLQLLGDDAEHERPLHPSALGDAWTMIKGTMRLYRSSK